MDANLTCPDCGAGTEAQSRYCEACGVLLPRPTRAECCQVCGRRSGGGVRCTGCGSVLLPGPSRVSISPVRWLAGVSDIGRRATRNDDALAIAAPNIDLGIIAIADGVGSTTGSWLAAKIAADTACEVLVDDRTALDRAVRSARLAVRTLDGSVSAAVPTAVGPDAGCCTLSLAVVEKTVAALRISVATVGDSRVYWLPDDPDEAALQLSVDDREAAERDAPSRDRVPSTGHAITAWIGPEAPASRPHQGTWELTRPGWLLVCTDGLWNYLSDPQALRAALRDDSVGAPGVTARLDPGVGDVMPQGVADTVAGPSALALASALVARANDLGGRDNITAALARWDDDTGQERRPGIAPT